MGISKSPLEIVVNLIAMNKILITGASGFVGKNLIPFLQPKLGTYFLLSRNPEEITSEEHLKTVACDLLDRDRVTEIMAEIQPTHILHLAWELKPGSYHQEDNLHWLKASIHLLAEFQKNNGKRWIGTGTCFEYDWSLGCCDETLTPLHPESLYGKTKKLLFDYSTVFCEHHNISFAWPRLFFLYGPHENQKRLLPDVIDALLKNQQATIQNGELYRDYMHIGDCCKILNELIFSDFEGAINISTGIPTKLSKIGETVAKILGKEDLLTIKTPEKISQRIVYGNCQKLEKEIQIQPTIGLVNGLKATIQWRAENLSVTHIN
jgi:UDP-glucuronate decarboxylase